MTNQVTSKSELCEKKSIVVFINEKRKKSFLFCFFKNPNYSIIDVKNKWSLMVMVTYRRSQELHTPMIFRV